jgi:hypothetical protein
MRTSLWILTSMFAVTLAACGDDKNDTETTGTTMVDPTATSTSASTSTSTDPTTGTSTTVDPVTTDPTTGDPVTTDPATTDPMTSSTGTTGDPVELTCDNYCALYASGCDDFSEYENNNDICLAQCAQWPPGIAGETAGDSLGCRLYHVGVANQVDADVHCPHAGPTGGGVCVAAEAPLCANYCATYLKNCVDKLNAYKDEADCLAQCAGWYPGKDGDTTGDTVGCREYHAGVALGDPMTHCPHAGPGGAMVCVAG